MAEEETTPPPTSPEQINLTFKDQGSKELQFRLKKTTKLQKAMDAWCKMQGVTFASQRFSVDGRRIQPTDNAAELELEDGDIVEVHMEQTGGC